MSTPKTPLPLNPNKGLGFMVLGGSLRDILIRLKSQPHLYTVIDVSYSAKEPVVAPITVGLPQNGLRLRFDGPDQRLRLIEVLDFAKSLITYKNVDLIKPESPGLRSTSKSTGPAFRHIYHKLFGPTFAGEFFAPSDRDEMGTYILSYPGVAFSFPLQAAAWSPDVDFVAILSSSAQAAKGLAIFSGPSWKEARDSLYSRPCPHPRSLALSGRGREARADEVDLITICGQGRLQMLRRSSPPFLLVLGETTPLDLVAELGPPDAIYRKYDRRLSIHKARTTSHSSARPYTSPTQLDGLSDTDRSSLHTSPSDSDQSDAGTTTRSGLPNECFYNYFQHGLDILISSPAAPSPPLAPPANAPHDTGSTRTSSAPLVATKVLLHGNVPGSYAFNRYRRARWQLDATQLRAVDSSPLTSETPFPVLANALRSRWRSWYTSEEEEMVQARPMVLNRGWGDSPGSSCELLGGWSEHKADGKVDGGNTELFGFPGLLVEALKNEAVSCLTIY